MPDYCPPWIGYVPPQAPCPKRQARDKAASPQRHNTGNWGIERSHRHACHHVARLPAGLSMEGDKGASFVSDDHSPFNRVWNWFCCLAFWSNYLELAKFTHLHGFRVLWTSIYMASEVSINLNWIISMTSLFRGQQNFSQLYTWWYSPRRQKFPKTVCDLK